MHGASEPHVEGICNSKTINKNLGIWDEWLSRSQDSYPYQQMIVVSLEVSPAE